MYNSFPKLQYPRWPKTLPRPKINAEMMYHLLKKGGEFPGAVGPITQFGNPNVQALNVGVDATKGDVFTCVNGGYATNIIALIQNTVGAAINNKCAVYDHNTLALVATTNEVSIAGWFFGWKTFPFPAPLPVLSSATDYILVLWSDTVAGDFTILFYDAIGAATQGHTLPWIPYGAWPDPAVIAAHNANLYSIYCN